MDDFVGEVNKVQPFGSACFLESIQPECSSAISVASMFVLVWAPVVACIHVSSVPMKHDPLGDGDNAVLRLAERGQLRLDSIVGVGHDAYSTSLRDIHRQFYIDSIASLTYTALLWLADVGVGGSFTSRAQLKLSKELQLMPEAHLYHQLWGKSDTQHMTTLGRRIGTSPRHLTTKHTLYNSSTLTHV